MLSVCRFNDFIKRSRTSKLLLFIHLIPEKMLNKALQLIFAFSFIIILLGCSEDTERFRSEAPHFARLTAKSLSDGSPTLRVGQPFVLTALKDTPRIWSTTSSRSTRPTRSLPQLPVSIASLSPPTTIPLVWCNRKASPII